MDKYKVGLGADVAGDTHGVTINFVITDSNNTEWLICPSRFIDANDLKECEPVKFIP